MSPRQMLYLPCPKSNNFQHLLEIASSSALLSSLCNMKCTTATGCQLIVLVLAGFASASAINHANRRRAPAYGTLAECLMKEVPGFDKNSMVSIQALRACKDNMQKREVMETEEAEEDAANYIIDGGKPNVKVA
ncbi:hypothetical protein HBI71_179000 [Parastagonospora nodorum]|nr:hypothetical protein HBI71_179000 [Parastagonospora nodorum]KAH5407455.1 hypothetical protein HBI47_172450 [Parastagonospora nodorum]